MLALFATHGSRMSVSAVIDGRLASTCLGLRALAIVFSDVDGLLARLKRLRLRFRITDEDLADLAEVTRGEEARRLPRFF